MFLGDPSVGMMGGKAIIRAPWNIEGAIYSGTSFNIAPQDIANEDFTFSTDGTQMYTAGRFLTVLQAKVYQYTLSTAWNVPTASYIRVFDVAAQTGTGGIRAVRFSSDGTKMYVIGLEPFPNPRIYQYILSTPWNISTASLAASFNTSAQTLLPIHMEFGDAGTKLYVLDNSGVLYQYNLSSAWSVAGAVFVTSRNTALNGSTAGVVFKPDGTEAYTISSASGDCRIFKFTLSTAWSLAVNFTYANVSLGINSIDTSPSNLAFKPDGTRMYVLGNSNDRIFQLDLV